MSYNMLGTYTFNEVSYGNFEIRYEIPDNCESYIDEAAGEYVISIKLKDGETEPSKDFIDTRSNASKIGSSLVITFAQYEYSAPIIRKPKIGVEF